MSLSEADTRAKLIDPPIQRRGWTEDPIRREETASTIEIVAGKAKGIEHSVYDVKGVNPNKKPVVDTRIPKEALDIIEAKGKEVATALATVRGTA